MRVISLRSENVLKLHAVHIRPDRSVVRLTGENGAGKSAVLNSLFYAMAGTSKHPSQPIRAGEHRATVRLELGEGDDVELTVIRRFSPSSTSLDVEAPNGARFKSPQSLLDSLIGALSFDPLAFTRLAPKAQLEQLRGIVPLDVDLDALDAQITEAYETRTEANRRLKSLAERERIMSADVDPAQSIELVDVSAMLDQMQRAAEHNRAVLNVRTEREDEQQRITQVREEARAKREEAAELMRQADNHDAWVASEVRRIEALPPVAERIDTAALRVSIDEAQTENAKREQQTRARAAHGAVRTEFEAVRLETEVLTATISLCEQTKQDAIARAPMPVEGLSFGDGEITYHGVPFAQASSAEQIRVATAIGMALNPKLRIIAIRDGSLLDRASLAMLEEMAEANDFQVWLECVQSSPSVGIHMVDGSVAAVNGEAVEQADVAEEAVA